MNCKAFLILKFSSFPNYDSPKGVDTAGSVPIFGQASKDNICPLAQCTHSAQPGMWARAWGGFPTVKYAHAKLERVSGAPLMNEV